MNISKNHVLFAAREKENKRSFLQKLKDFLFSSKEELLLKQSMEKLCSESESLFNQLEETKAFLSQNEGCELNPMIINEVFDPLLRDYAALKRKKNSEETVAAYRIWIQSADCWLKKHPKETCKKILKEELVEHIVGRTLRKIDRDIELLGKYMHHYVLEGVYGKEQIEKVIVPHIDELTKLKTPPEKQCIASIQKWRKNLAAQREIHFNRAIKAIDQ